MGNHFDVYLCYMLYILITMTGIFLISFLSGRRKRAVSHRQEAKDEIITGSVGVFFDKDKNVTIIPYVKDKYGVGRAMGNVCSVKYPYRKEKLGSTLRNCMIACKDGTPCKDEYLMKLLGFNGWKEFAAGKRNISVNYKEGTGIIFDTTKRTAEGAYYFHLPASRIVLPGTASDITIGETLLNLLQYCR